MARDGSGTYTLPAGNPVVTGTTIDASWANNTMNDLVTEMTDSLSRSGKGGMLTAFEFADGTAALPGLAFTSEVSSGFYRAATNDVRASIAGVDRARWRVDAANPFQIWSSAAWANVLADIDTTITSDWVFSGLLTVPVASVTAHEASIDHDALANFLAAEHIDWAITGAENLHTDRIPAATLTAIGGVERATQAEVDAGTDVSRYVTPETLTAHASTPITGAWTPSAYVGFSVDPTIVFHYQVLGQVVTVWAFSGTTVGTSDTAGFTWTCSGSMPAAITPTTQSAAATYVQDNSSNEGGIVNISNAGVMAFSKSDGSVWTGSGSNGLLTGATFTYNLD